MAEVVCVECGDTIETEFAGAPASRLGICADCASTRRLATSRESDRMTFSFVMSMDESEATLDAVQGSFMAPTALMKTPSWQLLVEGAENHDGVTPRLVSWTDSMGVTYVAFASSLEEEADIFTQALENEHPDLWLEIEGGD